MNKSKNTSIKLIINIISVTVAILGLCMTTYAVARKSVTAEGFFQTGEVKININDGLPIIKKDEIIFEPGSAVEKSFFIKNEGDCDVYFKVYFDNVDGELADILNVKVMDGASILFDGTPKKFTKLNTVVAENVLKQDESRELKIFFYYPEASDNSTQGSELSFNLCAKAVQAKNNTKKEFE